MEKDEQSKTSVSGSTSSACAKADNEKYIHSHPELKVLIRSFLSAGKIFWFKLNLLIGFRNIVDRERPNDVQEFARRYFTNPALRERVMAHLSQHPQILPNSSDNLNISDFSSGTQKDS